VAPAEDRNVATLWCPPRLITAIFVSFDLGAFFIQFLGACSVGAAYSSRGLTAGQKEDKTQSGLSTLRLGLVLQLICFGLFAIVGMRLLVVSRRWLDKPLRYGAPRAKWTRLNWTVNGAATVIMVSLPVRNIACSKLHRSVPYTECSSSLHRAAIRVTFNHMSGPFGCSTHSLC
jgi:ABC-type anion transport system duplicated permease subunit